MVGSAVLAMAVSSVAMPMAMTRVVTAQRRRDGGKPSVATGRLSEAGVCSNSSIDHRMVIICKCIDPWGAGDDEIEKRKAGYGRAGCRGYAAWIACQTFSGVAGMSKC